MSGAGQELQQTAIAKLRSVAGLGVFTLAPVQSSFPFATVDAGLESDWSYKGGEGREVRLAITIRDKGERPDRLQRLTGDAEAALRGLGPATQSWSIVSFRFLRSRTVREARQGWAAVIEYRARMLVAA